MIFVPENFPSDLKKDFIPEFGLEFSKFTNSEYGEKDPTLTLESLLKNE